MWQVVAQWSAFQLVRKHVETGVVYYWDGPSDDAYVCHPRAGDPRLLAWRVQTSRQRIVKVDDFGWVDTAVRLVQDEGQLIAARFCECPDCKPERWAGKLLPERWDPSAALDRVAS
jgi:hypothetical protein